MNEFVEEQSILILSQNFTLYSVGRLIEAGLHTDRPIKVIKPIHCVCRVGKEGSGVYYWGRRIPHSVAIIPRVGHSLTDYGWMVLRDFEASGYNMLNSASSISRAQHKYHSLVELSRAGIPVPPTFCTRTSLSMDEALEHCGGLPVIMKLVKGSQGVGVVYANTVRTMKSVLQAIVGLGQDVLIQRYVPEAAESDIRAFVLDGEVRAAIRRVCAEDDFRSNIHRGASAEPVEITDEERTLCTRAARVFGLRLGGVDFVRTPTGPLFLEVNPNPGFEGLESATGIDVAMLLISAAMNDGENRS